MINRSRMLRFTLGVALVVGSSIGVYLCARIGGTSLGDDHSTGMLQANKVQIQMMDDLKQGKYDDAVQTGLSALRNKPADAAILQDIAMVYLARAQHEPSQRERWASAGRVDC